MIQKDIFLCASVELIHSVFIWKTNFLKHSCACSPSYSYIHVWKSAPCAHLYYQKDLIFWSNLLQSSLSIQTNFRALIFKDIKHQIQLRCFKDSPGWLCFQNSTESHMDLLVVKARCSDLKKLSFHKYMRFSLLWFQIPSFECSFTLHFSFRKNNFLLFFPACESIIYTVYMP